MAGFEVIVRPVVFPNIRPQPSRSLPPANDDPEQGKVVIGGAGGGLIALTHSISGSGSRPVETETKRTFDVVRITPSEDQESSTRSARAGTTEDDVYIDVEVLNKLRMRDDNKRYTATRRYTPIKESDNIKIIRRDETRTTPT